MKYSEFDHMQALRWAKKIVMQKRLGGKCGKCGCYDYRVLEFHHGNSNKEKNISRILSYTLENIWNEAKKCTLLCRNCHNMLHSNGRYNLRQKYKTNMMNYLAINSCVKCGCQDISALDFHHINPNDKSLKVSNMSYCERSSTKNRESVERELDKCVVLCRNCHLLKHLKLNGNISRLDNLIKEKINNHVSNASPISKNRKMDMQIRDSTFRNRLAHIIKVWRKCGKNIVKSAEELKMDSNTVSDNLSNSKIYTTYRRIKSKKTSKYKGVSWINSKKKWMACIKIKGKTKNLGLYFIEEDARDAYIDFKRENSLL